MLEDSRGPPTWRLYTRLCNFVQNISTNSSTLGQCTHLELGEVLGSLFIVYNIAIFYFIRYRVFYFIFDCVIMHTFYIGMCSLNRYGFSAILVINRVSIIADFSHFGHK